MDRWRRKNNVGGKSPRAGRLCLLAAVAQGAVYPSARLLAGQFTVSDTGDSVTDPGSLRYAITGANASAGSTITIDNGLGTITPSSALPAISTTSVTIDDGTGDFIDGNLTVAGTSDVNLANGLNLDGQTLTLTQGTLSLVNTQTLDDMTIQCNPQSSGTIAFDIGTGGQNGSSLTLGSGATLQGGGFSIGGGFGSNDTLINNGTINVNIPDAANPYLFINGPNLTNNGTIEASNGVNVYLEGNVTNSATGTISVGNANLAINGIWTNSGVFDVNSGGVLSLGGNYTPASIGTINRSAGSTIILGGSVDNYGSTLTVNNSTGSLLLEEGTINGGSVSEGNGQTLSLISGSLNGVTFGGGTIYLSGGPNDEPVLNMSIQGGFNGGGNNLDLTAYATWFYGPETVDDVSVDGQETGTSGVYPMMFVGMESAGGVVTLGTGAELHGALAVENYSDGNGSPVYSSGLVNNGTINADVSGQTLAIDTTTFTNSGSVLATNGGILAIGAGTAFADEATLNTVGGILQNNGTATITHNATTGTIAGSGELIVGTGTAVELKIATGSGNSTQSAITVGTGSTLDITNNTVMIDYGSGSDPMGVIRGYLINGFNNGGWNATGIISSSAQTPTNGLKYGVGWADGADGTGAVAGLSSGQIELKYTLLGDANLDGTVNGSDFSILAANFGLGVTNWDQGNFLFSSSVNGSDFRRWRRISGRGIRGRMWGFRRLTSRRWMHLPGRMGWRCLRLWWFRNRWGLLGWRRWGC